VKIARRFNAGTRASGAYVPKGRLNSSATAHQVQPSLGDLRALRRRPGAETTLKRRAIFALSLRDKCSLNYRKALA